jgi:hypothetical protein
MSFVIHPVSLFWTLAFCIKCLTRIVSAERGRGGNSFAVGTTSMPARNFQLIRTGSSWRPYHANPLKEVITLRQRPENGAGEAGATAST